MFRQGAVISKDRFRANSSCMLDLRYLFDSMKSSRATDIYRFVTCISSI